MNRVDKGEGEGLVSVRRLSIPIIVRPLLSFRGAAGKEPGRKWEGSAKRYGFLMLVHLAYPLGIGWDGHGSWGMAGMGE